MATSWERKIRRAKEHISDLASEIQAYHATNPYKIITDDDPETPGNRCFRVSEIATPVPDTIGCIAGDAVHNARAAMDHFICGAVVSVTTDHAFPIWRKDRVPTRNDIRGLVSNKVKGGSPQLLKALTSMNPYPGGTDEYLWTLYYLDITDKHRLVVAVGACNTNFLFPLGDVFAASAPDWVEPFEYALPLKPRDRYPLEVGKVLLSAEPALLESAKNTKFTFDVSLGEPRSLEGEPIVPTLADLTNRVERLLETLSFHI